MQQTLIVKLKPKQQIIIGLYIDKYYREINLHHAPGNLDPGQILSSKKKPIVLEQVKQGYNVFTHVRAPCQIRSGGVPGSVRAG